MTFNQLIKLLPKVVKYNFSFVFRSVEQPKTTRNTQA